MTLTRDVIKAAKDKNKLWDEIIQEICRWGEESVQNGERFEQLAELEEKYKKGPGEGRVLEKNRKREAV